ncbi:MAG: hypothetical protein U0838_15840 [Chloroflexota bacterium]
MELFKDPRRLSVADATALLAAVGLDVSVKTYVGGNPAGDAASTALLERLHSQIHPALGWQTEVPFPILRDRRAWDAVITGTDWRIGVEAETHARTTAARRSSEDSRSRRVTGAPCPSCCCSLGRSPMAREAHSDALQRRFPVPQREALAALRAGRPPAGDAMILL